MFICPVLYYSRPFLIKLEASSYNEVRKINIFRFSFLVQANWLKSTLSAFSISYIFILFSGRLVNEIVTVFFPAQRCHWSCIWLEKYISNFLLSQLNDKLRLHEQSNVWINIILWNTANFLCSCPILFCAYNSDIW